MLNHPALSAGIRVSGSVLYSQRCKALDTTQKCLLTKYVPSENYMRTIGKICEQPLFYSKNNIYSMKIIILISVINCRKILRIISQSVVMIWCQ